jgi:CheY-like chemotaxis protein
MTQDMLVGSRVLIVEDEPIIAMMQTMILESVGCVVLGPAPGVDQAILMIGAQSIDLALLDINLDGEKVYLVADALAKRGVPFVFLTGYGGETLPPAHRGQRCLTKPCDEDDLLRALREALQSTRRTST